ncbi:MAG: nucleotidyltransferase family protein [Anaerolineaceae bacterium]
MYAIITAGGNPSPEDPLYKLTHGIPKALLPIAGKTMIQWVVDALNGSKRISKLIIVGLPPFTDISTRHPLTFLPDQGSIISNIQAGVDEIRRDDPAAMKTLIISSDIPAIKPSMVDWMIKIVEESDADIFYNVVTRQVMESIFPGSKRTYTRLRQLEVCGGDLNAVSLSFLTGGNPFFDEIINSRKNPFKQASLFGFDILFSLLLNCLSLQDLEKKISERIHARGKALLCPYAEIGMDVDKPHQFDIVQSFIQKQLSK